jgi:hypothetical protein
VAQVKIFGTIVSADVVRQETNGEWLMRSRVHAARLSPGTQFLAKKNEIIQMDAAEVPGYAPIPSDLEEKLSLAELERAMAEERKTLPSPAELITQHQKSIAEGKTLPGRPIQAPSSTAGLQK